MEFRAKIKSYYLHVHIVIVINKYNSLQKLFTADFYKSNETTLDTRKQSHGVQLW